MQPVWSGYADSSGDKDYTLPSGSLLYSNLATLIWLGNMLKAQLIIIASSTCFVSSWSIWHHLVFIHDNPYFTTIQIIRRHLSDTIGCHALPLGRYGNGASLKMLHGQQYIRRFCGELYKSLHRRIEALHNIFVRPLTREEKR